MCEVSMQLVLWLIKSSSMQHKLSMTESKAFAILIGKEGCGKTTLFSKITNSSSCEDLLHCCPCKSGQSYNGHHGLHIIDPNSNRCSLLHGLTCGKLNCIFVLVEFHPRIGSIMIDCECCMISHLSDPMKALTRSCCLHT